MSGSGIRWAICKSAPRSRQITTPASHHSVFYRPDALPAAQPTASKHWRQSKYTNTNQYIFAPRICHPSEYQLLRWLASRYPLIDYNSGYLLNANKADIKVLRPSLHWDKLCTNHYHSDHQQHFDQQQAIQNNTITKAKNCLTDSQIVSMSMKRPWCVMHHHHHHHQMYLFTWNTLQ